MANEGECNNPKHAEMEREFAGLIWTTRSQAGKIGSLQEQLKDSGEKLRGHAQWKRCKALFRIWQHRSGHARSPFTVARFKLALPYLIEYDDAILVRAIVGLCHEPYKGNNWWQTLFNESKPDNVERYANKALDLDWKPTLEELAEELRKKQF